MIWRLAAVLGVWCPPKPARKWRTALAYFALGGKGGDGGGGGGGGVGG
jgi:hypothetical protein